MILLLLTTLAFGGDREGIVQIPEQAVVTFPADTDTGEIPEPFTVPEFSYMMPEPMYDNAVAKAKKLAICEPDRDECYDTSEFWMQQAHEAMELSVTQFEADEEWQTRALTAEDKLRARTTQRNTAYAITATVVATFIGAVYVTSQNSQ